MTYRGGGFWESGRSWIGGLLKPAWKKWAVCKQLMSSVISFSLSLTYVYTFFFFWERSVSMKERGLSKLWITIFQRSLTFRVLYSPYVFINFAFKPDSQITNAKSDLKRIPSERHHSTCRKYSFVCGTQKWYAFLSQIHLFFQACCSLFIFLLQKLRCGKSCGPIKAVIKVTVEVMIKTHLYRTQV